jgi:hypothetical protein
MFVHRQLITITAICLLLSFAPAIGQNLQKSDKTKQITSSSSAAKASSPARIRFGGFSFTAGYSHYWGHSPYYYFYPYSFSWAWYYDPFYAPFYGPYSLLWYHPGWYTGFAWQPGMGEIKLRSNLPDADVFLNDAFAGKAKDLKTMWLEPGAYDLKVQADNFAPFAMRIYILSGKTLKVDAKLAPPKEP